MDWSFTRNHPGQFHDICQHRKFAVLLLPLHMREATVERSGSHWRGSVGLGTQPRSSGDARPPLILPRGTDITVLAGGSSVAVHLWYLPTRVGGQHPLYVGLCQSCLCFRLPSHHRTVVVFVRYRYQPPRSCTLRSATGLVGIGPYLAASLSCRFIHHSRWSWGSRLPHPRCATCHIPTPSSCPSNHNPSPVDPSLVNTHSSCNLIRVYVIVWSTVPEKLCPVPPRSHRSHALAILLHLCR